ncbi:hypothetical protein KY285_031338 [Solanum tuberosum]|nr:hypothetical protein KY284_031132 [Solanum tuberosum]KAH0653824.1 hypothetical protein KY289_031502 [Solanum tuberosum]KAH0656456.1 hypothetical protein KY285_031338 [Solanum tuberosum]
METSYICNNNNFVVNTDGPKAGQAVGPWAKPQRGPRIRQPNTRFTSDPEEGEVRGEETVGTKMVSQKTNGGDAGIGRSIGQARS